MTTAITAIIGAEPQRYGEYPTIHIVGQKSYDPAGGDRFDVTRIECREQNLGTYGLVWFDVYDGDRLATSMQASAVAEVHYERAES